MEFEWEWVAKRARRSRRSSSWSLAALSTYDNLSHLLPRHVNKSQRFRGVRCPVSCAGNAWQTKAIKAINQTDLLIALVVPWGTGAEVSSLYLHATTDVVFYTLKKMTKTRPISFLGFWESTSHCGRVADRGRTQ
jgi:hypothetical protein